MNSSIHSFIQPFILSLFPSFIHDAVYPVHFLVVKQSGKRGMDEQLMSQDQSASIRRGQVRNRSAKQQPQQQ